MFHRFDRRCLVKAEQNIDCCPRAVSSIGEILMGGALSWVSKKFDFLNPLNVLWPTLSYDFRYNVHFNDF